MLVFGNCPSAAYLNDESEAIVQKKTSMKRIYLSGFDEQRVEYRNFMWFEENHNLAPAISISLPAY